MGANKKTVGYFVLDTPLKSQNSTIS